MDRWQRYEVNDARVSDGPEGNTIKEVDLWEDKVKTIWGNFMNRKGWNRALQKRMK